MMISLVGMAKKSAPVDIRG